MVSACFIGAIGTGCVSLKTCSFRDTCKSRTLAKRTPKQVRGIPVCTASADPVPEQLAWVDAIPISEIRAGRTKGVFLAGLDVCIACAPNGEVFALGNKGPPLGVPLSGLEVAEDSSGFYIKCPQNGTLFDVSTGQVKDRNSWLPSPLIVSSVLRLLFPDAIAVPSYQVRESMGMIQVLVNVNARAQYEQKYWKGILDASGKADGSYY